MCLPASLRSPEPERLSESTQGISLLSPPPPPPPPQLRRAQPHLTLRIPDDACPPPPAHVLPSSIAYTILLSPPPTMSKDTDSLRKEEEPVPTDGPAAASEDATVHRLLPLLHLASFLLLLWSAYALYRTAAARMSPPWTLQPKDFRQHYSDLAYLALIGGTLVATGPTLQLVCSPAALRHNMLLLLASASGAMAIGGIGEVPWLHTSLASSASWSPPAVYVYAPSMLALFCCVVLSAARACRSREGACTWVLTLCLIVAVFSSAIVAGLVAGVPLPSMRFAPHHYQLGAYCVCACVPECVVWGLGAVLLTSQPMDERAVVCSDTKLRTSPSSVIHHHIFHTLLCLLGWAMALLCRDRGTLLIFSRFVFIGITLQGMAAYGEPMAAGDGRAHSVRAYPSYLASAQPGVAAERTCPYSPFPPLTPTGEAPIFRPSNALTLDI